MILCISTFGEFWIQLFVRMVHVMDVMVVDPLGDLQVSVDALNFEETNPMKTVIMQLPLQKS